ncbi:MAG: aspartate carbamoyltransferase [bacterium]
MSFTGQSIISANQFSPASLKDIFERADRITKRVQQEGVLPTLNDKVMATLFYEPSTRTRLSFESAMQRLGGRVVSTSSAKQYSSVIKGETLSDTIRTIQQYSDVIVLRHTDKGAATEASTVAQIPIINAGDGDGEHPTQALLDMYTILKESGRHEGLKIAMIGDLKYGRTVHSLSQLLTLYDNSFYFVSPPELTIPAWVKEKITCPYQETQNLLEILPEVDVLYVTRIQKERFESEAEYERYRGVYKITPEVMEKAKSTMVLMHPLPRIDEISPAIDTDPRAAYFRQVKNGMLIRMTMLSLVFGRNL